MARGVLNNPGEVSVTPRNTATELVTQTVHLVEQHHKRDLISHIIRESGWHQVLVFTRTSTAPTAWPRAGQDGLTAAAIHGNKSQSARTRALAGFKEGTVTVLVATDIAARGLDIDQLPQVVNFELPNVPEDYVHRIGRTGRAGATGAAVSLVDNSEIAAARHRAPDQEDHRPQAGRRLTRPPRPRPRSSARNATKTRASLAAASATAVAVIAAATVAIAVAMAAAAASSARPARRAPRPARPPPPRGAEPPPSEAPRARRATAAAGGSPRARCSASNICG